MKPKSEESIVINSSSKYYHIACWLNENNNDRHSVFNYKQCIGWNKLKRNIQNEILNVNGGGISFHGMPDDIHPKNNHIHNDKNEEEEEQEINHINSNKNEYEYEPPKKKRKLTVNDRNNNKYKQKKKKFKAPRMIKEKEKEIEIEKEEENEMENISDTDSEDVDTRDFGDNLAQKRITTKNKEPTEKGTQCQILYMVDKATQTLPNLEDVGYNIYKNGKEDKCKDLKGRNDGNLNNIDSMIPWDDICKESEKKQKMDDMEDGDAMNDGDNMKEMDEVIINGLNEDDEDDMDDMNDMDCNQILGTKDKNDDINDDVEEKLSKIDQQEIHSNV